MGAVGEKRITYDARGLAEPVAEAPRTALVEDGIATFDARDLTTRTINLELRRLLYEEGVGEVVVQNPQGRHSLGVGILRRCRIRFEGSLGYFACGLIDGPEIHITGRVGWSACENMMSGVVVVDGNGGSLTGEWRRRLERAGRRFMSECDSEIIAVYLAEEMSKGASLEESMHRSLDELDGVFTYIAVTKDELGVAKDELAAKPLVLYESDDLVALASEEIAIRQIVDHEIDTYDPYEREVLVWQR